jgi:AraC-like DNA-binding protein
MRRPAGDEQGTRLVGGFTHVPALIRQFGVDPAPILARARLRPGALDDRSNRIPYECLARLLSEAAARTGCPHFGLLTGCAGNLSEIGVLGELVRHSPTVGQALRELVVHQHLNSEGALSFLLEHGPVVDMGYAVYAPFAESTFHIYDAALGLYMNAMREICGEGCSPSEVFLPHSVPVDVTPYRQHFRAPLHFNAESCALRFPASLLTRAVVGADPERLRLAQAKAKAAGKAVLVEMAYRALRTLLLHGKDSGADVAQALAMHRRTLNRRLSAAGTTFQEVLDRVRFAVAKELLENSDIAVHEIAAALCYADLATFMRAFRRWTGTTPGAWRQSAR